MTTHRVRALVAALVTALVASTLPPTPSGAQEAVRLGTSSVGSTFYILAVGMSELSRKHASINATVEPVGGSTANMNGLAAKKVDLAVANAGAAYDAYHGNRPFKAPVDVTLIAQGQPSMRFLLVRRDAGITSPGDLVGKTMIAKRRALPELELIANALVEVYDLPKDKMRFVETVETRQATDALRSGSAQAAVYPGGLRMAPVAEMFRDRVVDFLYLPEDRFEALMRKLPQYFYRSTVPAGNFENQPRAWLAPTLNTYLVARGDVSDEVVYRFTKAVMAHHKEFVAYHADGKYWTVAHALSEPKIPFHPGAIRYYKEIGSWNAKLDEAQASLARRTRR